VGERNIFWFIGTPFRGRESGVRKTRKKKQELVK